MNNACYPLSTPPLLPAQMALTSKQLDLLLPLSSHHTWCMSSARHGPLLETVDSTRPQRSDRSQSESQRRYFLTVKLGEGFLLPSLDASRCSAKGSDCTAIMGLSPLRDGEFLQARTPLGDPRLWSRGGAGGKAVK